MTLSTDPQDIFQALLATGLNETDIKEQIKNKLTEFGGFIDKLGALLLVAKDNGIHSDNGIYSDQVFSSESEKYYSEEEGEEEEEDIDYDEFLVPLSHLTLNMTNLVLLGRISRKFPLREFMRKDGTPGLVGGFILQNGKEAVKIVLWNEVAKILDSRYFKPNEIVRVLGGYTREGLNGEVEVHIGRKGRLILAPKHLRSALIPLEIHESEPTSQEKSQDATPICTPLTDEGFYPKVSGIIKDLHFKEIDKKNGEKTFLLSFLLSDDSGEIKVSLWGDHALNGAKVLEDCSYVSLFNTASKFNAYSSENELRSTSKTIIFSL